MADAATGSVNVRALSEYVYPNNRATSVSLTFMPDGLSYLKMTEGGKKVDRFDVLNNKYNCWSTSIQNRSTAIRSGLNTSHTKYHDAHSNRCQPYIKSSRLL